jgi:hypothetical protein
VTSFRSASSLGPEHIGARVTIRYRNDEGTLSDVIGILERLDDETVAVRDRRDEQRTIRTADVVAARVIS